MSIPADSIDPDARKVIRRLVRGDYQAYLVGGCVRDLLLGRTPKDFDIATNATPNEVKSLFRNCRIIGRRFRLAHIFFGPKIIETATFRANPREAELGDDGEEAGGAAVDDGDLLIRRDNVFGTAEEDARRRDFTINGLFYDIENDEIIDYVGGLEDLAQRMVRTIGDPEIRFREDPIRILRAIKFAARLDFDIEENAWRAIRAHQREIPKCAPPRVLEEIYRLLRGGAARRSVELLRDTGVLRVLLPEIAELLETRPASTEAAWFWRLLDRIDADRERTPSNAVLLCVLLAPFVGEAVYEDPAAPSSRVRDLGAYLEEHTRAMVERMSAARRDAERARQILLVQRKLMPSKRRRPKAGHLLRRDWFEEAVHVFELVGGTLRPMDGASDELEEWRRAHKSGEVEAGAGGEAEGAPAAEEPGRRRRRRRKRGGRGRSEERTSNGDGPLFDLDARAPGAADGEESAAETDADDDADLADVFDPDPAKAAAAPEPAAAATAALDDEPLSLMPSHARRGRQTSDAPPSTGNTTPET